MDSSISISNFKDENKRVRTMFPQGSQAASIWHSGMSNIYMKISVENWWIDTDSSWNVTAHRDAREGEVKGKLANGVGSQYPSHYLGTWCIQHYYRWCRTPRLPVVDWIDAPTGRFKCTRPFRRKTKTGFCACAITFQLASTTLHTKMSHEIN